MLVGSGVNEYPVLRISGCAIREMDGMVTTGVASRGFTGDGFAISGDESLK